MFIVFVESGLQEALTATSALYDNNIETLCKLSFNDVFKIFSGATVVELILEPGLTVLQMAMKAKCFLDESNIASFIIETKKKMYQLFCLFTEDAYRIIAAGGFYVNHQRITNIEEVITLSIHILPNKISLIRVG